MAEKLGNWKRTGMCQEFSEKDIGKSVTLMGWVNSRRNLGRAYLCWLRDRSGVIQLVFDEAEKKSYFADAPEHAQRICHCGEGPDWPQERRKTTMTIWQPGALK